MQPLCREVLSPEIFEESTEIRSPMNHEGGENHTREVRASPESTPKDLFGDWAGMPREERLQPAGRITLVWRG